MRGSPRRFMVYAVDTRLEISSSRAAVVAMTVESSMLMATNVAAVWVILWNRHVSVSDFLKPWRLKRRNKAWRYVYPTWGCHRGVL